MPKPGAARKTRPMERVQKLGYDPADIYSNYVALIEKELAQAIAEMEFAEGAGNMKARYEARERVAVLYEGLLTVARETMNYAHPKLASMDVNAEVDASLTVNVMRFGDGNDSA